MSKGQSRPGDRVRVFFRERSPTPTLDGLLSFAVVVRFKATGNAPIMKQNFYKITASNQFRTVTAFLRKELGWKPSDPLVSKILAFRRQSRALEAASLMKIMSQFVYINSAFAPALDDTVANLYKVPPSHVTCTLPSRS